VVRGELPPYSVNVGAPAKTIGYRGERRSTDAARVVTSLRGRS
jgi:acetyltransferase-like isoleucine patch superfamily enzyme